MTTTNSAAAPDRDRLPITVLQSRGSAVAHWIGSAIFVAGGIGMCFSGKPLIQAWGVLAILLFGLGMIVFSIRIVRPGSLIVDSRGITQTSLLRTRLSPWHEVKNFRVWRVSFGRNTLVAFDDLRPADVRPTLRAINRSFGAEATLAPGWTMEAEPLATLLNAARDCWIDSAQCEQPGM